MRKLNLEIEEGVVRAFDFGGGYAVIFFPSGVSKSEMFKRASEFMYARREYDQNVVVIQNNYRVEEFNNLPDEYIDSTWEGIGRKIKVGDKREYVLHLMKCQIDSTLRLRQQVRSLIAEKTENTLKEALRKIDEELRKQDEVDAKNELRYLLPIDDNQAEQLRKAEKYKNFKKEK